MSMEMSAGQGGGGSRLKAEGPRPLGRWTDRLDMVIVSIVDIRL